MSRRIRKKKKTLERATPMVLPGSGGLLYVPPGALQSTQGQVFYGSSAKNIATGQSALFSPGIPLQPQNNVNPNGYPVQFRFPVAVNTFPVDRTSQNPDIPSFQQLRNLAKLYSGVTLCERAWADLVPRMQLKITLKPEYVADGADEKDYQKEISYFKTWFESPDKMHDLHSWIRIALREQTQIDELYIYKRKKRGGGLYALEIIAGDQFKPLLDDWGKIPQPPSFAYQQYPWGLPGAWFRSDEMIHYQESPAADNPYGQSRVERIILLVNQALRKQRKDLAHFTEGNIPVGMMKVPADATWTPDQIDSFEQAWNALLAGNASQQVRMRFTQPGMEYQAFEQYALDPTFDKFLINISVAAYGMSMQDVAFTDDVNRSTGDSQENMTYRRTIDPLANMYASFITSCINNDFDPDLHGDMFVASFGGYEEDEDLQSQVAAYSEAIQNAFISPANAAKKMSFPEIPETGPLFITKNGVVPLASFEIGSEARKAQDAAQLAGLQMAANPQQPQEQDEDDEEEQQKTSTQKKAKLTRVVEDNRPEVLQQHTGMMVAFILDPDIAQQLALPDGEKPSDMHVTLAYLGDMGDEMPAGRLHPVETLDILKTVLSAFAGSTTPLQGRPGGVCRFMNPDRDVTPVVVPVNAPGLQEWRRRLVSVLTSAGYKVDQNFDFLPHVTLAYISDDAPMPVDTLPEVYFHFNILCLAIGDDRYYFPIGEQESNGQSSPPTAKHQQPTEEKRYTISELLQLLAQQGQAETANQEDGTYLERSEENRMVEASSTRPHDHGVGEQRGTSLSQNDAAKDYRRWRDRAIDDVKAARTQRGFTTTLIPPEIHKWISDELVECMTPDQVREVFNRARDTSFLAGASMVESGGSRSSSNLLWRNRQPI